MQKTIIKQPEIIVYRGYPVEVHQVLTEDGYILGINSQIKCKLYNFILTVLI